MSEELGLNGQAGVFPLSDRFAEMGGISVHDDGGDQVEPGHSVLLALDTVREGDTLDVPKLERLARIVPDARANGKLHGKQPKLSDRQQRELRRTQATGEYSISFLSKLLPVSRPTVYRTLNRRHSP